MFKYNKNKSAHSGKSVIPSFPKNTNLSITLVHGHQYKNIQRAFPSILSSALLFALHYLKDIDDAEDTVQDCFMELWKRKEKGFEVSGLKSYLYSMVRNRCIDILKKDSLIDGNVQPSDLEEICRTRSVKNGLMRRLVSGLL